MFESYRLDPSQIKLNEYSTSGYLIQNYSINRNFFDVGRLSAIKNVIATNLPDDVDLNKIFKKNIMPQHS